MSQPFRITKKIRLKDFDPSYTAGLDKEETRARTKELCQRIGELQPLLRANARHGLLIVLQGMDTSGKDGAARCVLEFVNPAGVETTNFKAPNSEELAHDFLWRIHRAVPRYGSVGVWNRSHYEDVLVVRVLGLQPKEVWKRRFDQINDFEQQLVENGYVVLKFFLHISKQEQAERLRSRLKDRTKHWKFELADLKMRQHWERFQEAYEDVLNRCSPRHAPWHVVPANKKWFRDCVIAQAVVEALEGLDLTWPKASSELRGVRVR